MSWQIALGILIIIQTCSIILTKVAADKIPKRSIGIFYQYLICAIVTILYAFFGGKADLNSAIFIVGAIGFVNTFGNYFQWQASARSLSKTALFFPLMEVVTILLAVTLLRESLLWNFQLILGAGLCFLAMILFRLPKAGDKKDSGKEWFFFTLLMVIIFGVAGFLVKLFSFTISRETFLLGWYSGAFVGVIPIIAFERQNPIRVSGKTILIVLPVSIAITGALFALFWTYQLGGPVSLVLPIRGLAITVIPALTGWLIFKERFGLSKKDKLGFLVGIIGVILVLLR